MQQNNEKYVNFLIEIFSVVHFINFEIAFADTSTRRDSIPR